MSADQLFTMADPRDAPNHVRATEIRCDVCGMPAGMCEGVPAEVMDRMRRFINAYTAAVGWTFAKTMADIPHAYAVRERAAKYDLEAWFVWFVQMIRQFGYKRRWSGRTLKYVNVDGWRYWTMGNPIDPTPGSKKTTILNRAPLTREGREQLRRENGLRNVRWFECANGHRFGVVLETMKLPERLDRSDELHLVVDCPVCGHDIREVDGP